MWGLGVLGFGGLVVKGPEQPSPYNMRWFLNWSTRDIWVKSGNWGGSGLRNWRVHF